MANGNGEEKRGAFDELDDFWELDALLPPKAAPSRRPVDVETVEVSLGDKGESNGSETRGEPSDSGFRVERYGDTVGYRPEPTKVSEKKYPPITSSSASNGAKRIDYDAWLQRRRDGDGGAVSGRGSDEVFEYVPENPLIFRVKVVRRCDFDGIEELSLADMRAMADATAEFTGNVKYDAFFPQYRRMTEAQKACYIGFRTEVINGRYPAVSESYICFLLYEIINLPERFPPQRAVELFCALMREYKDCEDTLFHYMCDWLADLCLINRMNAPTELLEPVRERVYKLATWKEFFVPFRSDVAEPDACVLLTSASDYDYRRGKFYSAETAEYFETHIPKAVGAVIRHISASEPAFSGDAKDITTLSHDAFRSAFRSAGCRYTVSIDCACFTRSPLLRQTVTYLVKYAENFVREMLGIRSRLSVNCLGTEKKEIVKAYFEPFIKRENDRPPLKRGRKKKIPDAPPVPEIPEYERYYEPQKAEFSPELAERIESESWQTTHMLISAFGEAEEAMASVAADGVDDTVEQVVEKPIHAVNPQEKPETQTRNEDAVSVLNADTGSVASEKTAGVEIKGLSLILRGKSREFSAFARENGLLPDTLAERINGIALDVYGDIAVESDGSIDGFVIIEDYRSELTEIANGE